MASDDVERLRRQVEANDRDLLELLTGLAVSLGEVRRRLGMEDGEAAPLLMDDVVVSERVRGEVGAIAG